jgi:hypothetical protein
VGLALRLACAWEYSGHPIGKITWVDEDSYWSWARAIRAGQLLPTRPFYQDPLFPYLLAGVMSLLRTDAVRTLRLVLAGIGSLTPVLVFVAGRLGLGRAEGIIAGLAAAVYGPMIFTDGLLEKEGTGALAAALALALTARAARGGLGGWKAIGLGVSWGAVALLRSNALLVAPIGAAWLLGVSESSALRRGVRAGEFLVGFAMMITPVVLVNAAVSHPHEWLGTTWQAGAMFYNGNGPEATGVTCSPPFVTPNPATEGEDFAREARRRTGRPLTYGQVSSFWFREGLRRWREAPGPSIRLLVRKVGLLANDYEIGDSQIYELAYLVAAPSLACGVLTFGWIAPCAAMGLVRTERAPFWWFLVLTTAVGLASTVVFIVVGRYRIPWMPALLLMGASGVVDAARAMVAGRWAGLIARIVLLAAPAAWLAWRPPEVSWEERWGHAERMRFVADLRAGKLDAAIDALDDARALAPLPAEKLAEMLAEGPFHDAVAQSIRTALSLDAIAPTGQDSDLRRARLFRQLPEDRAESRRLLEAGLEARPGDPRYRREWGTWWLGEAGNPSARRRAVEELARAASGQEGDPDAAILLALLEGDSRLLDLPAIGRIDPGSPRLRMVRAILASRPR